MNQSMKNEKIIYQATELLGYMKGKLNLLDIGDFDYLSKEEAQEKVINALREQLEALEKVINE